jgi:hypothetical protein
MIGGASLHLFIARIFYSATSIADFGFDSFEVLVVDMFSSPNGVKRRLVLSSMEWKGVTR